ncbi:hypothetical protein ABLE68_10385 [Nocardioides sp. CN2-186]|uniref:hypothetical protein n=1 Tax=Nocardioides tweenelious TaxID=3156607 RepID=UPI0032B5DFDD
MDWQQLIDDAIEPSPATQQPVQQRVEAGRSALRRRRVAAGVAGVAAAAVVGAVAWALPQGATSTEPPITGTGRATTEPSAPTSGTPLSKADMILGSVDIPGHVDAAYDFDDGSLVVRDGWRIVRTVQDPLTVAPDGEFDPPTDSAGLVVTDGTDVEWELIYWHEGSGGSSAATSNAAAGSGYADFDTWLDVQVARKTGAWTPDLVTGTPSHLTLLNGTRIIDQRPAPELGEDYAVAELQEFNEQWWVVTRPGSGSTTEALIVTYPFEGDAATLDGFVDHVRSEGVLGGRS